MLLGLAPKLDSQQASIACDILLVAVVRSSQGSETCANSIRACVCTHSSRHSNAVTSDEGHDAARACRLLRVASKEVSYDTTSPRPVATRLQNSFL
eukprot:scaffold66300_cov27-Tisochrysis_lutea.AAC.1